MQHGHMNKKRRESDQINDQVGRKEKLRVTDLINKKRKVKMKGLSISKSKLVKINASSCRLFILYLSKLSYFKIVSSFSTKFFLKLG